MINRLKPFYLRYFSEIFSFVFFIFAFIGVLNHELIIEEAHNGLIAWNSHSIFDLYNNLKYEPHPPLWYLVVSFLNIVFPASFTMQVFNVLIASISAWIILKYSPLSRVQNLLLIFGYFPFYEFAIISRGYTLGVFFVLLFCVFAVRPSKSYLILSALLILLSLTSFVGLLLAIVFVVYLIIDLIDDINNRQIGDNLLQACVGLILFLIGALISLDWMILPKDAPSWAATKENFFSNVRNIYVPVMFDLSFGSIGDVLIEVVSIFILFFTSIFFLKRRSVFIMYVSGILVFALVFYNVWYCAIRHIGHVFILLICCYWMWGKEIGNNAKRFLSLILAIHFILGMRAYYIDYYHSVSPGKPAFEYLQQQGLQNLPVVSLGESSVCLTAYLNRPVFYAIGARWGTFVVLDDVKKVSQQQTIAYAKSISLDKKSDVLLVSNKRLNAAHLSSSVKRLREFRKSKGYSGKLYLYKVSAF